MTYDGSIGKRLAKWLKTDASDILFMYGAMDTWTAAQADLGKNNKVKKYVFEGKHHGNARIREVDERLQEEILNWVEQRLSIND